MIVVYGGTFDPVHIGHLRLAFEALEELQAEQLRFLPCHIPPHRPRPLAEAELRAQWLETAISGVARFALDCREMVRPEPSYSIVTLRELRCELGPSTPLVWLIGEDALGGLPDWHESAALWEYCHFAVLRRPTTEDRGALQQRYADRLCAAHALRHTQAGRIAWLDNTLLDVSASAIRARTARGLSARFLVPDAILSAVDTQANS